MNDIQGYFDFLKTKLNDLVETQSENIDKAADMIVESFLKGGRFYAFGTGHSHLKNCTLVQEGLRLSSRFFHLK